MTSRRTKAKKAKKQAIDVALIEVDDKKLLDTKLVADVINLNDKEILGNLEVDDPEVI